MAAPKILILFLFMSICIHALFFLLPVSVTQKPGPQSEEAVPIRLSVKQETTTQYSDSVPMQAEPVVQEKAAPVPENFPVEKNITDIEAVTPAVPEPSKELSQSSPDEASPDMQVGASDSAENADNSASTGEPSGEHNKQEGHPFADLLQQINDALDSAYPLVAKKKGWQGTVIVEIRLDRDGNLMESKIIEKSRYSVFDRSTLEIVSRVLEQPYPHPLGEEVIYNGPVKLDNDLSLVV